MSFVVRFTITLADGDEYDLSEAFPTERRALAFRERMLDSGHAVAEVESDGNGCPRALSDDPIGWCSGHGCYVDRCPTKAR